MQRSVTFRKQIFTQKMIIFQMFSGRCSFNLALVTGGATFSKAELAAIVLAGASVNKHVLRRYRRSILRCIACYDIDVFDI